ncbi:adenylate cyclase type 2, partial [Caerostris extrusa]
LVSDGRNSGQRISEVTWKATQEGIETVVEITILLVSQRLKRPLCPQISAPDRNTDVDAGGDPNSHASGLDPKGPDSSISIIFEIKIKNSTFQGDLGEEGNNDSSGMDRTSTSHHNHSLGSCSTDVATSHILRVILFVIANSFIFASSFINMVVCVPEEGDLRVSLNDTLNLFARQERDPPPHCQYGQAHIFPAVLTLTAVSLFLRLSYVLKFILMLTDVIGFGLAFTLVRPDLFSATLEDGDGWITSITTSSNGRYFAHVAIPSYVRCALISATGRPVSEGCMKSVCRLDDRCSASHLIPRVEKGTFRDSRPVCICRDANTRFLMSNIRERKPMWKSRILVWVLQAPSVRVRHTVPVRLHARPRGAGSAGISQICLLAMSGDRLFQCSELSARADFMWQRKLREEQEEVETMGSINKILLENILPAHVAQHFLSTNRQAEELYHERYRNVAVMFASIPNYKEFYDETDINKQGLECLRLLNEIICDFDKLLLKPKFSRIEKIKTIGSTYMAAAGLQPGREENGDESRQGHNLLALTEFAIALMALLDQINRESFQRFRLRVGINNGPVIAGVVGAQKPQYDIWGNTVNVASRMDSCGVMGKIQVTEDTAKILMEHNYECECRGAIYVKGKGNLTTYFVKTQFDRS